MKKNNPLRILIVATTRPTPQSLEMFYLNAFRSLGHEVRFATLGQRYGWRDRLRHHVARLSYGGLPPDLVGSVVVHVAQEYQPDLTIVVRCERLQSEAIRHLNELSRYGCINVYPDSPFVIPGAGAVRMMSAFKEYRRIYTFSRSLIPVFEQLGARSVSWLPFGFDSGMHRPAPGGSPTYKAAIAYLGAWGPLQEAWLEPLVHFGLGIYGPGWQNLANGSLLCEAWRKGYGIGSEMAAAIGGADIVFNLVRAEHGCAHSMKTFEIPACGGFMLTNWTDEQAEFFEDGKHCVFFHTQEEMLDKAAYYVKHDAERRLIAKAGQVAASAHSYAVRAAKILRECTK